jgi:hypothetical protein
VTTDRQAQTAAAEGIERAHYQDSCLPVYMIIHAGAGISDSHWGGGLL